ncbi:hypothetical protein F5050DRAFT_1738332 [Lentinula boryana]|uniref:FAD/NAD(P)-binding domain-containing protein n=1 Tax=Lentinula boryana TaxID=40481 RepID=A0ABQ8QLC4_9AGAR|nr:hypothetical protein F5050DRAFT_1738332 [Lentinula boryana]
MTIDNLHHFTQLRAAHPELTDSMLLNSNNSSKFSTKPDVVVAGAGIIGLCYAIQLKNISPHLNIAVYEKSRAPVQKIGESTLSSFSRFTNGAVMPHDYFFRLFGLKDGLQFYCIDREGVEVTSEDIGGLDLSFQLDRRMSELFFTMWAQRIGINVYHGVEVDFEVSDKDQGSSPEVSTLNAHFTAPQVKLKNFPKPGGTEVDAKLVCDASGFSRKLTSKFGNKETFDGWNCDAYWAYFKQKEGGKAENRLDHWDYPATKHMCFPEGWGWFIKLISWHHAPLANIMDLVAYIIDKAKNGVAAEAIPSTKALSAMFDCPFEFITSIGWAVRNDHKFPENLNEYGDGEGERKFNYFKRRYPTLNKLMNGVYELLPKYYGKQTYFVRKSMAYRSPVVAGEGWFAIGNSAGFTNPLISPGINAGIGTAVLAANLTKEIFDQPPEKARAVMQKCITTYQTYSHDFMIPRLHQMNHYWYNSFRDHRLFEVMVPCFWTLGIDDIDAQYVDEFTEEDVNWVIGVGHDKFVDFSGKVLEILEPSDGLTVSKDEKERVVALTKQCMSDRSQLFPGNEWGKYLRKHDNKLQRISGKHERDAGGRCFGVRCTLCKSWMHNDMKACPVCGA